MKLKRIVTMALSLIILAAVMSGVAGCVKNEDSDDKSGIQINETDDDNNPQVNGSDNDDNSQANKTFELNILTWADYMPGEVVKDFENETGIKIYYSTFDTNEEMLSKVQAQKNSYDIVICSDYIIELMAEGGILHELDKSRLPNYGNIDTVYLGQYFDPESKYAIPYTTYAPIIVYHPEKVGYEVTGYDAFWDENMRNKIVVVDGDREIIGLTAQLLGYSVNETDPDHLNEIAEKLYELKPNIVRFDANYPHESFISGEAVMGFMYGSQATAAIEAIPELEICYPKEGMTFGSDNIVVPEGAPNIDNVYKFLDYILDAQVSAKISSIINYSNTSAAAQQYLSEDFLNNRSVNIPSDVLANAEMYYNVGDAAEIYDDIWTRFKSR